MTLFTFFEEVVTAAKMHVDAKASADAAYIKRIEPALQQLILRTSNLSVTTPNELRTIWSIIRTDAELLTLISFVTGYVYGNMGAVVYKDACGSISDALTALERVSGGRVADDHAITDDAYADALCKRPTWIDIFHKNRWLAVVYVLTNCPFLSTETPKDEPTAD